MLKMTRNEFERLWHEFKAANCGGCVELMDDRPVKIQIESECEPDCEIFQEFLTEIIVPRVQPGFDSEQINQAVDQLKEVYRG